MTVKRWTSSSGHQNTNPATYLYYAGWNLVQEGPSAGNAEWLYFHGGRIDEMVAAHNLWTGGWNYYHHDARGHTNLLTDEWGNLVEQYEYHAFGYDRWGNFLGMGQTGRGNRFLFTGREWLRELRVYDFRHRLYHSELGRFLQPDPLHFKAGDYNLYRYCHNDPINRTDPDGLYGRGDNWRDEDWKKFDRAQQSAASRLERASAKMNAKVFEKVFGKGSATAENMAKVQQRMQRMAAALRDDGSNGYKAHARSQAETIKAGNGRFNQFTLGYHIKGNSINANVEHVLFGNAAATAHMAGHESGHVFGLKDFAYKHEAERYKSLSSQEALMNADSYMDFAR